MHLDHGEESWERRLNIGHVLQRLTRAHGAKLLVVITEGNKRPAYPKIAAMYATECNIAVRNHIPIFKHWKEYKKHPAVIELSLGRLRVRTLPEFNCNNNHFVLQLYDFSCNKNYSVLQL